VYISELWYLTFFLDKKGLPLFHLRNHHVFKVFDNGASVLGFGFLNIAHSRVSVTP
jgi:hypothetical protein